MPKSHVLELEDLTTTGLKKIAKNNGYLVSGKTKKNLFHELRAGGLCVSKDDVKPITQQNQQQNQRQNQQQQQQQQNQIDQHREMELQLLLDSIPNANTYQPRIRNNLPPRNRQEIHPNHVSANPLTRRTTIIHGQH